MAQIDVKFMKGNRATARKMGNTYKKKNVARQATKKRG